MSAGEVLKTKLSRWVFKIIETVSQFFLRFRKGGRVIAPPMFMHRVGNSFGD